MVPFVFAAIWFIKLLCEAYLPRVLARPAWILGALAVSIRVALSIARWGARPDAFTNWIADVTDSNNAVFMFYMVGILPGALLGFMTVGVFRRARQPDCPWSRRVRILAQAPGWILGITAGIVMSIVGVVQIRRGERGLGSGLVIAMVMALIKGVIGAFTSPKSHGTANAGDPSSVP